MGAHSMDFLHRGFLLSLSSLRPPTPPPPHYNRGNQLNHYHHHHHHHNHSHNHHHHPSTSTPTSTTPNPRLTLSEATSLMGAHSIGFLHRGFSGHGHGRRGVSKWDGCPGALNVA